MKRRQLIGLIGGAAIWPSIATAQQPTLPVVAFLRNTSFANAQHLVAAAVEGLKEEGFIEGENVTIEHHSGEGQRDKLQSVVEKLVHRPVNVILTNGIAALSAKAATATVPIVFATGGDPVELGLVRSLNRPGGNVTGANFLFGSLGSKRLELFSQLVPKAALVGVLINPNTTETEAEREDVKTAARSLGLNLAIVEAKNAQDIAAAFTTFVDRKVGAVFVGSGNFTFSNREQIISLAQTHKLPVTISSREGVVDGALMSYGPNQPEAYRNAGVYAGRILKGQKPGDLPIIQSSKFEFVINLKTALSLDLAVSRDIQLIADEVIE